jgi:transglutaminase-like putative cysteine protease
MSWLHIVHETVYSYKNPVQFGPHRLVIRPREGHDMRVEEHRLAIAPAYMLEWSRDVFGNSVANVCFREPAAELHIRSEVVLRQTAPFPLSDTRPIAPVPFPARYSPLEQTVAAAYQATSFPEDVEAVRAWLASGPAFAADIDAESVVAEMTARVKRAIGYRRREEKGTQSPAETLANGTGSCRDLATLLLEALRLLGFPARFVSGYLDCRDTRTGHGSTHAWAEVYLPEVGWTGFDPMTGRAALDRHVAVGVSNHPRGVMPITGVFYGDADEYIEMKVSVLTEQLERWP